MENNWFIVNHRLNCLELLKELLCKKLNLFVGVQKMIVK